MFDIDVAGLAELEGGKPPHRLAFEPVANVFDEFRGYEERRKRPSYCAVTLEHSSKPRGVILRVADDGAGFANERDVWTLFASTPKRSTASVSGRFNAGDKQLIALARKATVKTNSLTVMFADGQRHPTRHRAAVVNGTIVEALMPWSLKDLDEIRGQLLSVLPPEGLAYTVDGQPVQRPETRCSVSVALPTVLLSDGVLRDTVRKTVVRVVKTEEPTLYELGIPVCDLAEIGFPWSLDVEQKVPVPLSRDSVSPSYLFRLIGSVLEQSAMDGIRLLTNEEEGAPFIRGALDWVKNTDALKDTISSLYGDDAVRPSSDPVANAKAAANGASFVPGRTFSKKTRRRMEVGGVLPTAKEVYGGCETLCPPNVGAEQTCPRCRGTGVVRLSTE